MDYSAVNKKRRAVNFFDETAEISIEQIRRIYEEAKLAPTSFNMQPYKVIVAHSPEAREKLMAVAFNQPKVKEASAVFVILGYKKAYLEWDDILDDWIEKGYMKPDKKEFYKGMAQNLYQNSSGEFVSRNSGLFAMNLMLAAENQGWETHPMDGMDLEGVKKLYGLSDDYLPVMLIAVGRKNPEKALLPQGKRREFEQVFEIK